MKIVLAGHSACASRVEHLIRAAGIDAAWARTPEELKAFPESPVILLTETETDPFLTDEIYARRAAERFPPQMPVVLLLDREKEASEWLIRLALERALFLASCKRRVAVLARSVRTSGAGVEELYRKARSSGVLFLKYETVFIRESESGFLIAAEGEGFTQELDTRLLIDCAEKADPALSEFAKILRLRTPADGRISAGCWYLYPDLTSRRDVWCLDPGRMEDRLEGALAGIIRAVQSLPEDGEEHTARVEAKKCAFCYTCYRACPHAAPEPDGEGRAMRINPVRCVGCGICAAICPANAILLSPEGGPERKKENGGKLLALCCENSAALAAREAFSGLDVLVETVPCGGYLNEARLAEALSSCDRVLAAVCVAEACRHFDGNRRAHLQEKRLKELLERMGLDSSKVGCVEVSHAMPNVLRAAAERMLRPEKEGKS
jgi:Pyruvate/2-oxoacid:ferredoxin oxidoreductase delta subunit/coenzyme F420-reducing hydrogenase delta subunit